MKVWKQLSSKVVFKNKFWSYVLDEYAIGNDMKGEYHYCHTPGSTLVIPMLDDNRFVLIKQYRYLNRNFSIEFPCGGVADNLSREDNARKELREECGYDAEKLTKLGEFSPFTGASDEMCWVYLGQHLKKDPLPADTTEEFEIVILSRDEIEEMIRKNIIWDGLSLAAWSLLQPVLQQSAI